LSIGTSGYCSQDITDSFTFYRTSEGFVLSQKMVGKRELVIEVAEGEEAKELEEFIENQRKMEEQKEKEKKENRTKLNRQIAEQKKKKEVAKNQINLFDDL